MNENALRRLVRTGKYRQATDLFAELTAPTPEDLRWAGLALFNQGRPLDARALLLRARGHGCSEAAIELATVYRQLGDPRRALGALDDLPWSRLGSSDRALALRERGVLHYTFGELRAAYQSLEDAWEHATRSPDETSLLPGIALSLGNVCLSLGEEQRALYFLESALPLAHDGQRLRLLTVRTACELYSGLFGAAHATIAQARVTGGRDVPPTLLYFDALLHRYEGQAARAVELFGDCVTASRNLSETNTECYAELGACAACLDLGEHKRAERHLARAQALPMPEKVQGLVHLRRGQMLLHTDTSGAAAALRDAVAVFHRLNLRREGAWALLHLAAAHLRLGDSRAAERMLDEAMNSRAALGESVAVALELRGLPELCRFLSGRSSDDHALYADWQSVAGCLPLELRVTSLGSVALCLDRTPVRPNASLQKTVELVCYLTVRGATDLRTILSNVFPERSPETARMYFHLIRTELARLVPGVEIDFLRDQRLYRLRSATVRIRTDIGDIRQLLNTAGVQGMGQVLAAYRGPFLLASESEWAAEERSHLEWLIVKVGLETLEEYFERGDDRLCLDLAQRLLEVEPLNEAVHGLLIRATGRLRGAVAARQVLQHASRQFMQEVGEVPPSITRLSLDLSA